MLLDIITIPNKNLRQISKQVDKDFLLQDSTQKFIDDMIETMLKKDGIGLAAIQVDQPLKMFTVATDEGELVFVNPQIIKKSWKNETEEEGCLSVPEVYGLVKRPKQITIKAQDRLGNDFELDASGLLARVIQHENDHTNGILFIDKVKKITKGEDELQNLQKK